MAVVAAIELLSGSPRNSVPKPGIVFASPAWTLPLFCNSASLVSLRLSKCDCRISITRVTPSERTRGSSDRSSLDHACFAASIARSTETARDEQRIPHFSPSRLRQIAQDRTNSTPLRQRRVIEIKRARDRHPVINGQDYLSFQSSNRSRRRRHDDFVQPVDDIVSCEN
jgi:hypothetical protein